MESSPPPSYTSPEPPKIEVPAGASDASPPAYTHPSSYSVGGLSTSLPFVNVAQIKDHLTLLHAFAELRIRVETLPADDIPQLPSDKERRWPCFVGLAVER
jgi:hypothetical protein